MTASFLGFGRRRAPGRVKRLCNGETGAQTKELGLAAVRP